MRASIVAAVLGVCLVCLGWVAPALSSPRVCVPFSWTESVGSDTAIIHPCFERDQVVKIKTIYSGKSGNMVEVILRGGTWFYKNGMTASAMKACVAGRGPCDHYQNVQLRDLTRGDISIFKKKKRLHPLRGPRDSSLNRDAVVSTGP